MKRLSIIAALLLLCLSSVSAQKVVRGIVLDSATGEGLPFVNILINGDPRAGTVTDIDGDFDVSADSIDSLVFSYVGYAVERIALDDSKGGVLRVSMSRENIVLSEAIVVAGENPAHRIIRLAVENKTKNDPENIESFRYKTYNKVVYDFEASASKAADSFYVKKDRLLKGGHVFLMESIAEREFIAPDNSQETILATKVSGFEHPSFAPLATDIQPFAFYDEVIEVLDSRFINPVSKGSIQRYFFQLQDTTFHGGDSTFIISFQPREGKNFEGLKGLLYINSNGYAIQNVIASPFEKGFVDVRIEQQYRIVEGERWFPEKLNYELIMSDVPDKGLSMRVTGRSHIEDVELYASVSKQDFGIESIVMADSAGRREPVYWDSSRVEPLDRREVITYEVVDSLGEEFKFDKRLDLFAKLGIGKIPAGPVDIDISRTLVFNEFEGWRLGLGVYTNEDISETVTFGGFAGYGTRDNLWKYGGNASFELNEENEVIWSVGYQNTLLETGVSSLNSFDGGQYNFRNIIANQMDRIQNYHTEFGFRFFRYAKVYLGFDHFDVEPQYSYAFREGVERTFANYSTSEITFKMRYAHKEQLMSVFGQRISRGSDYPVFYFAYTRGLEGVFNSDLDYHKVEARIEGSVYTKFMGESRLRIDAGLTSGNIPYGRLFTGEGSYDRKFPFVLNNYFQTAMPYEFLSDRYVNIFFAQDFGSLLFKTKRFKPGISIHQNMGWGSLSEPSRHEGVDFNTKEKGFFETGLQIDNIFRIKYLNVAYLGFGGAVFMRYGPYAYDDFSDNLAFKVSFKFSVR